MSNNSIERFNDYESNILKRDKIIRNYLKDNRLDFLCKYGLYPLLHSSFNDITDYCIYLNMLLAWEYSLKPQKMTIVSDIDSILKEVQSNLERVFENAEELLDKHKNFIDDLDALNIFEKLATTLDEAKDFYIDIIKKESK